MEIVLVAVFSYFCGSIPFGLILTQSFIRKDIRKIGSGNIGATNVLRSGNKYLAFLTLILDVSKGYIPVLLTKQFFPELLQLSALSAFLGHLFPIWLKFKGGKGVATFLGILFAISYGLAVLFIVSWLAISLIFRYSSLSSIFSSFTVFMIVLIKEKATVTNSPNIDGTEDLQFLLFIILILIIFTHRKNISNLKNRTEQKIKL